jgi:hypothetical protein
VADELERIRQIKSQIRGMQDQMRAMRKQMMAMRNELQDLSSRASVTIGRPRLPDHCIERAAVIYKSADANRLEAVMHELSLSRATAARRIQRARLMGLLPTGRNRA